MKTSTLTPTMILVTTSGWVAFQVLTRWAVGGRAALTHSQQWEPTGASRRHSGQAGLPQRVHDRPVTLSLCVKQVSPSIAVDCTEREQTEPEGEHAPQEKVPAEGRQ